MLLSVAAYRHTLPACLLAIDKAFFQFDPTSICHCPAVNLPWCALGLDEKLSFYRDMEMFYAGLFPCISFLQ